MNGRQIGLQVLDLSLVLDPVLFIFNVDVCYLRLDLVLLLHIGNDRVEVLLQVLHLFVDIFG